ncbi:MAG: glycosyltransferase family 2 protein [Roseivivax sp.]|nr:glycosyltransferase family 2 protein [Roseivivax sp.]
MTPVLAVIIPHYNDVRRLTRCLAALMPQVTEGVEVVVVDNDSTQDLGPIRHRFPGLRIVTEHLKGAAEARNRGVAETRAPQLAFIDSDCVPEPDWIAVAQEVKGRADLIGGAVMVFEETPPPRSGAEAFELVFAFDNRRYVEQERFSVTANLLTRRDVFDRTGPFVAGKSEDLDWCRRAVGLGYRIVYEDRLRVAHPSRQDWPALKRKWKRLSEESFGVNGNAPAARLKWALKALAMPVSILVHTPRVLQHQALSRRERRAALMTLGRLRLMRMGWMLRQAVTGRA